MASPCQVGLAAGAVVVVDADDDGAVAVAAADHRALPLKGQVPACPCFLHLCLDLSVAVAIDNGHKEALKGRD